MPRVSEMLPPRNTAAAVCSDDFARMSEEEQEFLRDLATAFITVLEDCERALAKKFDDQLFGLEEGNALWSLLPAKVRTAITRGRGNGRERA